MLFCDNDEISGLHQGLTEIPKSAVGKKEKKALCGQVIR